MEKVILLQKIQNYLTRLNDLIIISNKSGETIISKITEGLIRELFNIIYDNYNLTNCNLYISNYPAIDLHDTNQKVAIQVTSNKELKKITETFEKFFSKKLNIIYDTIYFVILANKKYDLIKLESLLRTMKLKHGISFNFNLEKNIIDLPDLYNIISNDCDIDQVIKITDLLEKNFDSVKGITDLNPYYNELKSKFFDIVMDDTNGLTLNSIYVEPDFLIHEDSLVKNSSLYNFYSHDYSKLKEPISIHELFNSKISKDATYDNLFNKPNAKLTFVLGYPGQGKTSFCQKLLFDLITNPKIKNIFYLKLRNVNDTKKLINNPFNVILEELQNNLDTLSKTTLKNSVTILDGLDELYMKDNLNSNDIEDFCKNIIRECEKFTNWDVIITTRHGYINFENLYRDDYIAIALKPLDINQQTIWLRKFQLFHPESWLTNNKLLEFNKESNKDEGYIGELLNQPLLLYIIASLENEINKSTDRSEIYNKLFDQIIDRKYSKDGQIENLKKLTKEDLRLLLQEIAFLIYKSGKGFVTTQELLENQEITEFTNKIGNNNLAGTLKGILISFYFKERNDTENENNAGIEFFHKSLQEYLTSEKIVYTVSSVVLNQDIKGKYILKKENDFLIFWNSLFSSQILTPEIWSFIEEIVLKEDLAKRIKIGNRLVENISYFFDKDFINVVIEQERKPLNKIIFNFSAYWIFLNYLKVTTNFVLNKEIGPKIIFYFKLFYSIFSEYGYEKYYLSYQTISQTNFEGVTIFEDKFVQTTFNDCRLHNTTIYESDFEDSTFIKCDFYDVSFYGGYMKKIMFLNCALQEFKFKVDNCKEVIFKNCTFMDASLAFPKYIRRKTITFDNVIFSENAFDVIESIQSKFKFKNCKIRLYIKPHKKGGIGKYEFIDITS